MITAILAFAAGAAVGYACCAVRAWIREGRLAFVGMSEAARREF